MVIMMFIMSVMMTICDHDGDQPENHEEGGPGVEHCQDGRLGQPLFLMMIITNDDNDDIMSLNTWLTSA